jgi:hypothetical protein
LDVNNGEQFRNFGSLSDPGEHELSARSSGGNKNMEIQYLILGGTIIDGTGAPPYEGALIATRGRLLRCA